MMQLSQNYYDWQLAHTIFDVLVGVLRFLWKDRMSTEFRLFRLKSNHNSTTDWKQVILCMTLMFLHCYITLVFNAMVHCCSKTAC